MNSFFETTHLFIRYQTEHFLLLIGFTVLAIFLIRWLMKQSEKSQQKIMLGIAIAISLAQLLKVPINMYVGIFDSTKDVPLHLCNFLPFIMVWIYATKSRLVWATTFFWVILGVSQANFTPSVEFRLFHYDAIRYWMVHLGLVLLAIYPAIAWKWALELKDVLRTFLALNGVALVIYGFNEVLNSNYMYLMDKPQGTTFYSILPDWPVYILVLEVILIVWSFTLFGIFKLIQIRSVKSGAKQYSD